MKIHCLEKAPRPLSSFLSISTTSTPTTILHQPWLKSPSSHLLCIKGSCPSTAGSLPQESQHNLISSRRVVVQIDSMPTLRLDVCSKLRILTRIGKGPSHRGGDRLKLRIAGCKAGAATKGEIVGCFLISENVSVDYNMLLAFKLWCRAQVEVRVAYGRECREQGDKAQ